MSIEILYHDQYYLAVSKPSGLLIHSYKEKCGQQDTLLRRLRSQTGFYLYPIHRLDRPVSGIVLFGLEAAAVKSMKEQWHSDNITKKYLALCKGHLDPPQGFFDFPLKNDNGMAQDALTCYQTLKCFEKTSLVEIEIKTGRKHQIRRHFGRRSHNIIGDVKHGRGFLNRHFRQQIGLSRIFLHAHYLKFQHPYTDETITIESPLPIDLEESLHKLS